MADTPDGMLTTSVGLKAFTHRMHVFVQIISMQNTFFELVIGIFTLSVNTTKNPFYTTISCILAEVVVR